MKIPALVGALVLSLLALASPSYADEEPPAPTVVWPEVTSFNPSVYTYEYSISGMSGTRRYFLQIEGGATTRIPADGTFEIDFGWSSETGAATVLSCLHESFTCTVVSTSPRHQLVQSLWMDYDGSIPQPLQVGAGEVTLMVSWWVNTRVPGQTLTWRLAASPESEPIVDGVIDDQGTTGTIAVVVPAEVPTGTYFLYLHTEVNDEVHGHLQGTNYLEVKVDRVGPALSVAFPEGATFYPATDRHLDTLRFWVRTDEVANVTLRVTNAEGAEMWTETGIAKPDHRRVYEWLGRSGGGTGLRPEGTYLVTVTGTDKLGNVASTTAKVRLDHAKLRDRTTLVRVGAASSVVDRYTRCGSLRTPSSHGWRGSLGFLTDRRCGRVVSVASTLHRAPLPRIEGLVGARRIRVSMVGGANTSRPRSRIGISYLAWDGKFRADDIFGPAVRRYDGQWLDDQTYVTRHRKRDVVTWSMGTGGGYGYDVREFVLTLRYRVFT